MNIRVFINSKNDDFVIFVYFYMVTAVGFHQDPKLLRTGQGRIGAWTN